MDYKLIGLLLVAIVGSKVLYNLTSYLYLRKFHKKFNAKYSYNSVVKGINLSQYAVKLSKLLLDADILITTLPLHIDRLYVNQKGNPFDYLDSNNKVVNEKVDIWVKQAIGVYKERMLEAINPLFWIKLLVFMPQRVVAHLGGNSVGILSKILNFLWWIIITLISIFQSDIREFLLSLMAS